jgi:hypothetical protein
MAPVTSGVTSDDGSLREYGATPESRGCSMLKAHAHALRRADRLPVNEIAERGPGDKAHVLSLESGAFAQRSCVQASRTSGPNHARGGRDTVAHRRRTRQFDRRGFRAMSR